MHLILPEIENEGVFEVIVKVLECVRSDLVRGRGGEWVEGEGKRVDGGKGRQGGWVGRGYGQGGGGGHVTLTLCSACGEMLVVLVVCHAGQQTP